MPRQTSIQLTAATERQIANLQTAGFGTFTDIVRIAIDRMAREESNTMNSTYYVEPEMLGDDATDTDADRIVELLQERGVNAARGHAAHSSEADCPDEIWEECLDILSREKYVA